MMPNFSSLKKYTFIVLPVLYFIFVYLIAILPLSDYDIWFHLKSGEIIAQRGIIHYDVFSYRTAGREWYPYEWLFQVIVYYWKSLFGFESIKYFIAVFPMLMNVILFFIVRKFFKLHTILSLAVCLIFTTSLLEFFTARPQAFAYTFLFVNLFLILLYFFKGRNLLILSVPITIAWSNLHGSIFLDVALFFGYTFVATANYFVQKDRNWLKKAQVLGIFTVITTLATILPPIGFTQYRLLIAFFVERNLIGHFISEWVPLDSDPFGFYLYSLVAGLTIGTLIFVTVVQKSWKQMLWTLPLLPFIFAAYLANRNLFLAYISIALYLGWILSTIKFKTWTKILISLIIIAHIWLLVSKRVFEYTQRLYFPVAATQFIKDHLTGHMFNEYGYGGYLLYNLYPKQKVFIDGRTDLYLCCEIPDLIKFTLNKNLPDSKYAKFLNTYWDKYQISFVVMRTQKHSVLRKIGRILTTDPNWSLVYWDDDTQIFARKDGKNNETIKNYGATVVTPYDRNPYQPHTETQAMKEYRRMITIADSAKSRNAIGFLLLKEGQFDEAQQDFELATHLDPTFESPYMNLAELAVKDGNIDQGILLYQRALKLAPDRGLIYIRLGQLMLQRGDDTNKVKGVWTQGFQNTIDTDAKKQLGQLLASI